MQSQIKLEDRIGETLRAFSFPIESGKIGEFARAMRDPSPLYRDIKAAHDAGFSGIPAPLTFSVASVHYSGGDATDMPLKMGLDLSRTVNGEQRWVYHRPFIAGEVLQAVTKIVEVDRKAGRGGEMLRVLTETQFRDAEDALVVSEFMLTIELPAR